MSIIRIEKRQQFLVISQNTVNDLSISWEAKGMLTYLLGRPDNWKVSPSQLTKHGKSGRDKVYKIINELVKARYIKKNRLVNKTTKKVECWEYVVHETPINPLPESPVMAEERPLPEKPEVGYTQPVDKPLPDLPDLVKPTLTNTDNKLILKKTYSASGMASPSESFKQDENNDFDDQIDFVSQRKKVMDIDSLANVYIRQGDRLRFIKTFGSKISQHYEYYLAVLNALNHLSTDAMDDLLSANTAIPYCMKAISNTHRQSL